MRVDGPHMVSVLAASAEQRGERVKGRNGAPEGEWWARSRPTVPHDSAAARALTTASTEGLYMRKEKWAILMRSAAGEWEFK